MKLVNKSNADCRVTLHNGSVVILKSGAEYSISLSNRDMLYYNRYRDYGIYVVSSNTPSIENAQHSPTQEESVVLKENSIDGAVETPVEDVESVENVEEIEEDTNTDLVEVDTDTTEETTEEGEKIDYSGKSLSKLKKIAEQKSINYPANITKKQLLELLNGGN